MQLQEREADHPLAAFPASGPWYGDAPSRSQAPSSSQNPDWRLKSPSKCSIYHLLEVSKSREGISLTASPNSCHKSQHPRSRRGRNPPALSEVHNNSQQSQFLLLAFLVCPSLMSTALQRDLSIYLRCDIHDEVWVQTTDAGSEDQVEHLVWFLLVSPHSLSSLLQPHCCSLKIV